MKKIEEGFVMAVLIGLVIGVATGFCFQPMVEPAMETLAYAIGY